uniref:Uncharacterized protein n=1 Tax=Ditylenchus dipsaci TaxID=166011 RepID=A0A915DHQ7_9BILA
MGVHAFLRFLRDVEGMDEVKRQMTDGLVHLMVFRKCLEEINRKVQHMPEFSTETTVEINGFSAKCIEFDVSKNALSVHHPLWRFIAGLFTAPKEILSLYVADQSGQVPDALQVKQSLAEVAESSFLKLNMLKYCGVDGNASESDCASGSIQSSAQLLFTFVPHRNVRQRRTHASGDISPDETHEFIIRVLDRFGLSRWAEIGFEETPTPVLSSSSSMQQQNSSQAAGVVPSTPATPSATPEELRTEYLEGANWPSRYSPLTKFAIAKLAVD